MPFRALLIAIVVLAVTPSTASATPLDRLIDDTVDGLLPAQLPWGGFTDPLAGPRFGYGAMAIGWVALRRAQPGPAGDARRHAAALALRAGARVREPGGFQTWVEALALAPGYAELLDPDTRAALSTHLQRYTGPAMGDEARGCFDSPRCFHNLEVVDAVGSLELTRTGLRSPAGTRLADPAALTRSVHTFLTRAARAAQLPTLRVRIGSTSVTDAGVLSDGERRPLAYHTLTTALLVRALHLGAPATVVARRALWALVALADPRGNVAWMGRGQYHLWSLAATYYAASAGASAFAERDPELAARLWALAAPVLAELERRRGAVGLLPGPSPRASLAGFDDSADSISCNGLALLWLQLALDDAGPAGPAAAPPAHGSAHDPSTGLATLRAGGTWLAVHATARHPRDARYDAGLLSALVAAGDGWRPVVGERPNTAAEAATPTAGPFVGSRGPGGRLRVGPRAITLGAWRFAASRTAFGSRCRARAAPVCA